MLLTLLASLLVLYMPARGLGPALPWHWTLLGVGGMLAVNTLACWTGTRLAGRAYDPHTGAGGLRVVGIFRVLHVGVVGLVMLDVFALGWPRLVENIFGACPALPLLDDLVLLSPVVLMMLTVMAFQYRFERSKGPMGIGLAQYLVFRVRTEPAILLLPWLLMMTLSDLGEAGYLGPWDGVLAAALVVAIVIFGPVFLRFLWHTSRLSEGPLRERLEALCRNTGFRCRDILVWHTHGRLPNAGVIGPTPWFRYVLVTDALLGACTHEEIEGVFAHEVGHIRRHHMALYALFAVSVVFFYCIAVDVLAALGWMAPLHRALSGDLTAEQALLMLAFALFYWVFAFGWLSRRLEQEADLYSFRTASDPAAFLSALRKLCAIGGTPPRAGSWRHFSIARRTGFLADLVGRPERAEQAQRSITLLKVAFVGLCAFAALYFAAGQVGVLGP